MRSGNHAIVVEFDEAARSYFIVWTPLIASAGGTEHEALEELRDAAHFGVDTMIDMKIEDIKR
jgi:hypothetical protein